MADEDPGEQKPQVRNWAGIGAVGGFLSGVAAIMGVVVVLLNRDSTPLVVYPSPGITTSTVAGSPSTTAAAGDPTMFDVLGMERPAAVRLLEGEGWTVNVQPALVRDQPRYTVVAARPSGSEVRLYVADVPFCETAGAEFEYCHGRPIAQYQASTGRPVRVGQTLTLTDRTFGPVERRRWRWNQDQASGYFELEEAELRFVVAGEPGPSLTVTLEVSNAIGRDEITFGWEVIA